MPFLLNWIKNAINKHAYHIFIHCSYSFILIGYIVLNCCLNHQKRKPWFKNSCSNCYWGFFLFFFPKTLNACVCCSEADLLPKPPTGKESVYMCVSSHICVSTAGWASCPISVRPDMIRRQIVSSSSLSGSWRFCSKVRKGLNADTVQHCLWYFVTTKTQIHWKQASTDVSAETQALGNIKLIDIDESWGDTKFKWSLKIFWKVHKYNNDTMVWSFLCAVYFTRSAASPFENASWNSLLII